MMFRKWFTKSKDQWTFKSCFLNSHTFTKNEKLELGNFSQPNVLTSILPQGLACAQKEFWKAFLNSQDSKNWLKPKILKSCSNNFKNFDPNNNKTQISLMHEYAHHPQPKIRQCPQCLKIYAVCTKAKTKVREHLDDEHMGGLKWRLGIWFSMAKQT